MNWKRFGVITLCGGFTYEAIAGPDHDPHNHSEPTPPRTITLGLSAVTTTGTITNFFGYGLTARGDG